MCSQRESAAMDAETGFCGLPSAPALLARFCFFSVVKGSGSDFDIAFEFGLAGNSIELHLLAHDLVRAMLACRFNVNSVLACLYTMAVVVPAIPNQAVFAGGTRGAGNGFRQIRAVGQGAQLVGALPRF